MFDGSLFGRSSRADFHFFRRSNGLILYEICVDGELLDDLAQVAALIAAIIVIIIARGRIPRLNPVPVPAMA